MKRSIQVSLCVYFAAGIAWAQETEGSQSFTRKDSLRGTYSSLRSCYDIKYYELDVKVDIENKSLTGSNKILFSVVEPFDKIQVDLFENMHVDKILFEGRELPYEREYGAVFIKFPRVMEKNSLAEITFYYSGKPIEAKRPPWEGGFTWTKDEQGNPWVCVTCQGTGASLWWPNKDHQADKPDIMLLRVTVPNGLMDVSNGRLRSVTELSDGWTRYDWFISYPINNYNVTVNIGKYAHFGDRYVNGDTLSLDYYVMAYDLEKAIKQFRQAKTMLRCFEKYFGKYTFYRDGYKLVESPHLGMEHQSAVAYGNHFLQGYLGRGSSPVGVTFDFIIVHESAHEWWGNSVTSKDIADMWIHESFGAYAEAVYVECLHGYKTALEYINGKKFNVRNDAPIQGVYNVHKRGSGDMYDKGQLVLNTLRSVINDDKLWFDILRGIQSKFKYQTINADDLFNYINERTRKDLSYFFNQYWKYATIPQLEISVTQKGKEVTARYCWKADVIDFHMPIKVTTSRNKFEFIYPTTSWQTTKLSSIKPQKFRVAEDQFYVGLKLNLVYLDPNRPE